MVADPRQAVRSALAAYLKDKLPDAVKILDGWPAAGAKIAMPAVSVVTAPGINVEYHQPRLWRMSDIIGVKGKALYSYGKATFNLQLDCWENYPATRDVLALQVERELNRPADLTLGVRALQDYDRAPGLVLRIPEYFGTLCEFVFEPISADLPENSRAVQEGEWRQPFAGTAHLYICDEQSVPVLKQAFMLFNGESIQVAP